MGNDVILFDQSQTGMPAAMAGMVDEIGGDLSGGVSGSYAILTFKGSRFSIKHSGNMTPITNEQGDPVGSFEAVLVKANPYLTKQFYAKGFVEGDASPPDCFSINGKTPSESSPSKQHSNCAACPQNAFTKINATTGKKTKACQDNRKIALLPADDLVNELFGGPMLARVPAASLKDLAIFGDTLKSRGYTYNAVRVRISFDLTVSFPKLVFKAIRPLTNEEAAQVMEWYQSDAVNKMLADFDDIAHVPADVAPVADDVFEEPQAPKAPVQAAPPVVKPAAKVPAAPPAAAPKAAGATFAPKAAAPVKPPAPVKPKSTPAPAPAIRAVPESVDELPGTEVDTTTEQVPGNLENDIAGILSELNAIAGD
jgi:hypothetical protein